MTKSKEGEIDFTGVHVAVVGMLGYAAAAVWGRYTFDGDMPWDMMTAMCLAVSVPVDVASVWSRRDEGCRLTGPQYVLVFLAALAGTLSGILLGT